MAFIFYFFWRLRSVFAKCTHAGCSGTVSVLLLLWRELSPYINENRARFPGFGLVACRTVARNRVEDCYELDETRGTGFAGSVRQAAFQFLVRPPRVNDKLMVGEWVMIRIDYRRVTRQP